MKKYTPQTVLSFINNGFISIAEDGLIISKCAIAQLKKEPIAIMKSNNEWFIMSDPEGFKILQFGGNHRIPSRMLGVVLLRDMGLQKRTRTRFYLESVENELKKFRLTKDKPQQNDN